MKIDLKALIIGMTGVALTGCGARSNPTVTSTSVRLEFKVASDTADPTAITALSSDEVEVEAPDAGVTFSSVELSISEIRLKL